jgi:hypothetical protein
VPFQRSASAPAFEPPTAVQAEEDMHATPDRTAPPCEGLAVRWIRHVVPFQRSANVPEFESPTAVHAEGDVHATLIEETAPRGGVGGGLDPPPRAVPPLRQGNRHT